MQLLSMLQDIYTICVGKIHTLGLIDRPAERWESSPSPLLPLFSPIGLLKATLEAKWQGHFCWTRFYRPAVSLVWSGEIASSSPF